MSAPIFILGATATGKSAVGMILAEKLGAEICAVDAFQIYRGLDIGTGKDSREEQQRVPHWLTDLVDPLAEFSVADYAREAESALLALRKKKSPSVWVGGTGLYYRVLREGLSPAPASDPDVLRELEKVSLPELQEEIRNLDPDWAAEADLSNPRRILRALAVYRQTGKALSAWHAEKTEGVVPLARAFVLLREKEDLRRRIEKRVGQMLKAGWAEEVKSLLKLPGWEESQSARALGYREVAAWLRGDMDEKSCREAIVLQTGQYAKRQLTWFRRESNLQVIDWNESDSEDRVALRLQQHLASAPLSPE